MSFTALFLPFGPAPAALAFVLMLVLYQLWHSSLLFRKSWVRHSGIRPGDMRLSDTRRLLLVNMLGRAVWTLLIGAIAGHLQGNASMLFPAIFAVWLLFTFEQLMSVLARREPVALYFLTTLRSLATLMLGAMVYYLWSFL